MDSVKIDTQAQNELQDSFASMLQKLAKARKAIDDPALKPPPATARNLAEGYRYLSGYTIAAYERAFSEDVDFPYFRRAIQTINKSTWDNSDNLYLSAAIDGEASYRIRCQAADFRHWQGQAQQKKSSPWYVIFTAITHYTGDSGELAELTPVTTNNGGSLDGTQLQIDDNGSFEILLAPEKPQDYQGNFICTKTAHEGKDQVCNYIICRELFANWETEQSLDINIVRLDKVGEPQPPLSVNQVKANLARVGELVDAQMRFWNDFFATILDGYGDSPLKTSVAFPAPNQLNQPAPPTAQVGAAQATNIYSGGMYALAEDEALIIEQTIPVTPNYTGINLNNIWGESFDYANYQSSLNNVQAAVDSDGKVRYVIAHQDPGIQNWLDTTGHYTGMLSQRWAYTDAPNELPSLNVTKVKVTHIDQHLPKDTQRVSSDKRKALIEMRQAHVQRRFRQY